MSNSWRPKEWINPYRDKPSEGSFEYQVFERGADAMLEAVRNTGIDIPFGVIRVSSGEREWLLKRYTPGGKVIYIPDDEEV